MTAATGYTQNHRPRPGNHTTEVAPLVLLYSERATHIATANRHYIDSSHCLHWTRGRYTNRYIALGP